MKERKCVDHCVSWLSQTAVTQELAPVWGTFKRFASPDTQQCHHGTSQNLNQGDNWSTPRNLRLHNTAFAIQSVECLDDTPFSISFLRFMRHQSLTGYLSRYEEGKTITEAHVSCCAGGGGFLFITIEHFRNVSFAQRINNEFGCFVWSWTCLVNKQLPVSFSAFFSFFSMETSFPETGFCCTQCYSGCHSARLLYTLPWFSHIWFCHTTEDSDPRMEKFKGSDYSCTQQAMIQALLHIHISIHSPPNNHTLSTPHMTIITHPPLDP